MSEDPKRVRQRGRLPTFTSVAQLKSLATPEKSFYEYPSAEQTGLFCRVMPKTKDGRVRRTWVHRYKHQVTQADGSVDEKTVRETIGLATPYDNGDQVISLDEAKAFVLRARVAQKTPREDGVKALRLTVRAAWELYPSEKPNSRGPTLEKDARVYSRYFQHIENRYLDELNYGFWNTFRQQLVEGTMVVGTHRDDNGALQRETRGPLAPDSLHGVFALASTLYVIAHKHKGLVGLTTAENPAAEAKKNIGAKFEREHQLTPAQLRLAWLASDQLMSPWWRDQLRLYVLTGLRHSLMASMRFDEVDFGAGTLSISPHKRGTKRRGKKTPADAPDIVLPLSQAALAILRARLEFAPDPKGPVWYSPKPTRGKARKDAVLTDPRAAWGLVEELVGVHFTPQDLRRTFAGAGAASGADVFGVSMLMLHSGAGLAAKLAIPAVTVRYMKAATPAQRMRSAAEAVAQYVLELTKMDAAGAAALPAVDLPEELEEALAAGT